MRRDTRDKGSDVERARRGARARTGLAAACLALAVATPALGLPALLMPAGVLGLVAVGVSSLAARTGAPSGAEPDAASDEGAAACNGGEPARDGADACAEPRDDGRRDAERTDADGAGDATAEAATGGAGTPASDADGGQGLEDPDADEGAAAGPDPDATVAPTALAPSGAAGAGEALDAAAEPADASGPDGGALATQGAGERDASPLEAACERILASPDPVAEMRLVVDDVHRREIDADVDPDAEPPTVEESFLARQLDDAGLMDDSVELPQLSCIRLHLTGLFYLRSAAGEMSYGAKLRIVSLEAALNAAQLVHAFSQRAGAEVEDELDLEGAYRIYQGFCSSICAQVPNVDGRATVRVAGEGENPNGEWAVRRALSWAIEVIRLPYRLTANYRCNLALGDVAIQVDLTPASVFPRSAYVDGLGVVPTSGEMRRKEASRYALRVGLALAACAFHTSQRVRHVWVQGVLDTPSSRTCYYHARFSRSAFSWLELDNIVDPISCYQCLGGHLHHEGGVLLPVEMGFSLDDERFCPPRRYELPNSSKRVLPERYARALGATRVSDLAIDEEGLRSQVADDVVRRLGSSTAANVRMMLDLAKRTGDSSVSQAARRTASRLIDGSLSDEDGLAVREEFVHGDDLSRAVERANGLAGDQRFPAMVETLEGALAPIEEKGDFADGPKVVFRNFGSYVDRAFYNRLHGGDGRELRLVPRSYVEALVMLAGALLVQGEHERATRWARRAAEVAPMSPRACFVLSSSLMAQGETEEASGLLCRFLGEAHDATSAAMAYYQLAHIEWAQQHLLAAEACYLRILGIVRQPVPLVATELAYLASLLGEGDEVEADPGRVSALLEAYGIPVAPTERMERIFAEGLSASFDAELFPVAKSFIDVLASETGDDVIMGIMRSVEGEPDQ
jgi:tetratricopeptide (TPR) repeat protein